MDNKQGKKIDLDKIADKIVWYVRDHINIEDAPILFEDPNFIELLKAQRQMLQAAMSLESATWRIANGFDGIPVDELLANGARRGDK